MDKGENEQRIKILFRSMAEDIHAPDIDGVLKNLEKRFAMRRKRSFSIIAAVVAVLLLGGVYFSEPVLAVPGFLRVVFSRLIGDTVEMHQRSYFEDGGIEIIGNDPAVKIYDSLNDLVGELPADFFKPDDRFAEMFIFAETNSLDDQVFFAEMEFSFREGRSLILKQFASEKKAGSGRVIDVEDMEVIELNDFNHEVLAFIHKSGLITLEWNEGPTFFELSGNMELEEILADADELGLLLR